MTIEAIRDNRGFPRARVTCDDCGREDVVPASIATKHEGRTVEIDEGQVIKKMAAQKWALVKGTLRCPTCEAKRKAKKPMQTKSKPAATELRSPTPKQKREIIGMLEIVYDDEKKRFKDGESDKTVAEAIGDGVLFGWVAQVREELFGPDTRNEEVESIRKRLSSIENDFLGQAKKITDAIAALKLAESNIREDIDALRARLEAIA